MSRRGNAAIVVCLMLSVLMMFAALAVDIAYARFVDLQLQVAADAASHAGAAQLNGTEEGLVSARDMSISIGAQNSAAGVPVVLDVADVTLGIWDEDADTFSPSADAPLVNAVQVDARYIGLGTFFAAVMGRATVDVGARSIMVVGPKGASEVNCFIPLAIPQCYVDSLGLEGIQSVDFTLQPAGSDNIGWGRPNGDPDAGWSRDQIQDCLQSTSASVGDPIGLQNGAVQSALTAMAAEVNGSPTTWDESVWGTIPARLPDSSITAANYGRTYEGVLSVFDGGPEYCTGAAAWNGTQTISGFHWGAVYDVVAGGPAAARTIRLRIDTTHEIEVDGDAGGPDWGVTAQRSPHMVAP